MYQKKCFNDYIECVYEVLQKFEPWNKEPLNITDILYLENIHCRIHHIKITEVKDTSYPIGIGHVKGHDKVDSIIISQFSYNNKSLNVE